MRTDQMGSAKEGTPGYSILRPHSLRPDMTDRLVLSQASDSNPQKSSMYTMLRELD